jgi:hypothetical protein
LLKERGLGKLYTGNKKVAWKLLSGWRLRHLMSYLKFKVGDLVHDCDGFNHTIKDYCVYHVNSSTWLESYPKNETYVIDLDQFEFEGGRLSCGCSAPSPPISKEEIERYMWEWYANAEWVEDEKLKQIGRNKEPVCDELGRRIIKE